MHKKAIVAVVLYAMLIVTGCGSSSNPNRANTERAAEPKPAVASPVVRQEAKLALSSIYRDEDDDDTEGEELGRDPKDSDADGDNDHPRLGYYDRDDTGTRDFGHAASPRDKKALISLTRRYYAAAATENGAAACALLYKPYASIVVEDYGRGSAGPSYLSSGTTCPSVLTLIFRHFHTKLVEPIEIIRTRVSGNTGLVLIGTANTPASDLETRREKHQWRTVGMLASSLP